MIRNEHACTNNVNCQRQMIRSWCKQIYIVVDWLIMTRCAAAVTHSIFISDDGRGGAAGGAAEVWFPVWWVAEQLLPALTLVLDISVG